jgi:hypothetical protein
VEVRISPVNSGHAFQQVKLLLETGLLKKTFCSNKLSSKTFCSKNFVLKILL